MDTKKAVQDAIKATEKAERARIAAIEAEQDAIDKLVTTFSLHTWMAATRAEFPPMAKWTLKEEVEAVAAWRKWWDKEQEALRKASAKK
jgi:hypothetical protein